MSRTFKRLTILLVVSLLAVGGILGGLSATAAAQTSDEEAIKAEVAAAHDRISESLSTADLAMFDSLFLQTDDTTYFPIIEPFRVEGFADIRSIFAPIYGLPPGTFSNTFRQVRINLLGDNAAVVTSHVVGRSTLPPSAPPTFYRQTGVYQKIDGDWLIVHVHLSVIPE